MAASNIEVDNIDILPFEPCFQEPVVQMFIDGLSPKSYDFGPTVQKQQRWFVDSKLSEDGGDMYDIWESFMEGHDSNPEHSKYFWVAFDQTKQKVVGHVGVIMSTYGKEDKLIYHSEELNPSNVCELVRMGVHEDYRGKKLGKRLCKTVEEYAMKRGMKQIVLSTLDRMNLARSMYEGYGFRLVYETKIPADWMLKTLGPGEWEEMYVVHYIKPVNP